MIFQESFSDDATNSTVNGSTPVGENVEPCCCRLNLALSTQERMDTSVESFRTSLIERLSISNFPTTVSFVACRSSASSLRVWSAVPFANSSIAVLSAPPEEKTRLSVATYPSNATSAPSTASFSSSVRSRSVVYSGTDGELADSDGCGAGSVDVGALTGELSAHAVVNALRATIPAIAIVARLRRVARAR